jgi:hypothetical protein
MEDPRLIGRSKWLAESSNDRLETTSFSRFMAILKSAIIDSTVPGSPRALGGHDEIADSSLAASLSNEVRDAEVLDASLPLTSCFSVKADLFISSASGTGSMSEDPEDLIRCGFDLGVITEYPFMTFALAEWWCPKIIGPDNSW